MAKKFYGRADRENLSGRIMKARGEGMIKDNMSMRSNLPDTVMTRDLGPSPYYQIGELPGPFEGVEQQMAETQFDFKKEFKPYK